jgi:hypothetical protein
MLTYPLPKKRDERHPIARHTSVEPERPAWAQLFSTEMPMPAPAVLAFVLAVAVHADTGQKAARDSVIGPLMGTLATAVRVSDDTVRRRRKAIEVSDWYERRLRIHRVGAYTIFPLFAVQAVAGNQIFQDPRNAPSWAKTTHRAGATGLAAVFTVNTVTGLWNLWDSREAPGGGRRTVHALLMLASDAGFTYAGARLSEQAENSVDKRRLHRIWAYSSMATALTGVGVITLWKED